MDELSWVVIAATAFIFVVISIGFSWVFEALDKILDILERKEKDEL